MDFRIMALSLLFWLAPSWASTMEQMDNITQIVYQYPKEAMSQILQLEKLQASESSPDAVQDQLRLSIIKCETLLQLGENEAAINLAQLGDAKAKSLHFDAARPYFLTCMADAHASYNNLKATFPLLDSAITLAKVNQQPQALVNALRLRGQLDTDTDNFNSAIEDLRIALDIYPESKTQTRNWFWPPQAYIYAAMGNLLYATGDSEKALSFTNQGLNSADALGKVRHNLLLNAAVINISLGNLDTSDRQLKEAKAMLPELDSELELAFSYAIIASIDLRRGRLDNASDLVKIALNTFEKQRKVVEAMRAKRLLAQIFFAQGKNDAAMGLMQEAIRRGTRLEQYTDLKMFYDILSQHYAKIGDYKQAYEYLEKAFEATQKSNEVINSARFIQYKARLNQQVSLQSEASQSMQQVQHTQAMQLNWAYSTLVACAAFFALGVFWLHHYRRRQANQLSDARAQPQALSQQLDAILHKAKKDDYPLALLLVHTGNVAAYDLPELQHQLGLELREQDKLVMYSQNELIILLPYTTGDGAQRVINQLLSRTEYWRNHAKVTIGLATMQQFDTLVSMIKRANLNQLSKIKLAETNSPHSSAT